MANMRNPYLVDYAFRQLFSLPRSIYTFPTRERALVQEVRDGNTPEKVRGFYEALLRLRKEHDLLSELRRVEQPGPGNGLLRLAGFEVIIIGRF